MNIDLNLAGSLTYLEDGVKAADAFRWVSMLESWTRSGDRGILLQRLTGPACAVEDTKMKSKACGKGRILKEREV